MPNWVFNTLTISAAPVQLAEIKTKFVGAVKYNDNDNDNSPLTFHSLIPRPAENEAVRYYWNSLNWGTKWDACEVNLEEGDGQLIYRFETAYEPPLPFIYALCATYPELSFNFAYVEEQGWGGTIEVDSGKVVNKTEYDMPNSHAESIRHGNQCWCNNSDEPVFNDCYIFRAKSVEGITPETLEAVEGIGRAWHGSFDELIETAQHL